MKLLKRLVIPGMIGGIIGAFLLTRVPEDIIRPVVSVYLILMGVVILLKVLRGQEAQKIRFPIIPLGLAGGFFDAIGGGGWGPIVTTTLVARGKKPRFAIGTVNLAEFFVTVVQSVTFIMTIGITHWVIILGLVIGGGIAAPLAALLTSRLPRRHLSNLVGLLIIALSVRTIFVAFR